MCYKSLSFSYVNFAIVNILIFFIVFSVNVPCLWFYGLDISFLFLYSIILLKMNVRLM